MNAFAEFLRSRREALKQGDPAFSLRRVAERIGVEPSYLSKVERGVEAPPSEATIVKLAKELGEDTDVMLALGGKVSSDLQEVVLRRPQLFARLLRELKDAPERAVLRIVREVRDGDW